MNKQELREYFLSQLTNGNIVFRVAKGEARYKMSRGSFKTSEHIRNDHTLTYKTQYDNRYIFSDGKVEGELILDDNPDVLKFHFHVDHGYNRFYLCFKTFEDEHIYGCGEQFTTVDLKGKQVPIWVSEHQQVMKIAMKLLRWKLLGKPEPDRVTKYKNHQTELERKYNEFKLESEQRYNEFKLESKQRYKNFKSESEQRYKALQDYYERD